MNSQAITEGIQVCVEPCYLAGQSEPTKQRYVFAYSVSIANRSQVPVQLVSRHWVITDGAGQIEEVEGPGVVGETPRLEPGADFEYTSGCILRTPRGTMHGTYRMLRDDGSSFDAEIAPFVLATPGSASQRILN